MGVLLRALGMQAILAMLGRLPPSVARPASLLILLAANAIPLLALVSGAWGAGDVLVAYWLENIAIGFWTLVRLATSAGHDAVTGEPGDAPGFLETGEVTVLEDGTRVQYPGTVARVVLGAFFAGHYGVFTLVHGIFTFILARSSGITGTFGSFAGMFLVLLASHGLSTGIHWFGRGERVQFGLVRTMFQPYPRLMVLHIAVLGSAFLFTFGGDAGLLAAVPGAVALGPGLLLIALKTTVDAVLHVRAHRPATAESPATLQPAA